MRLILTALPHASDALFSGTAHVTRSRYSIGRGENNDWVLSDAKRLISKNHCVIEPGEDGFRLVDRSTNGTTVSGKPVDRNTGHLLGQGDEIELGPYRFRVALEGAASPQNTAEYGFEDPSAPRITSILHDVARSGVSAKSMIPGGQKDAFEDMSSRKGRYPSGSLSADLGWDGPPPGDPDVARPAPPLQTQYREFADRMEQGPAERVLIDLPRPSVASAAQPQPQPAAAQLIPDNWLDEEEEAPPAAALIEEIPVRQPAIVRVPDLTLQSVTAVSNVEIPEQSFDTAARPASGPVSRSSAAGPVHDIIAAFCDGLGIQPDELANADVMRFFHNAGRAVSISVSELQNAQIGRSRAAALLEMAGENLGHTPWIFSLSGDDKTKAVHAVAAFLAEAEPRDLEMMRADYRDIQALVDQLSQTLIGLVENLQQSLSAAELDKHVSTAARAIPSLRKAALWDAFLAQSGLFPQGAKGNLRADLLPLLKAELKKHEGQAQ